MQFEEKLPRVCRVHDMYPEWMGNTSGTGLPHLLCSPMFSDVVPKWVSKEVVRKDTRLRQPKRGNNPGCAGVRVVHWSSRWCPVAGPGLVRLRSQRQTSRDIVCLIAFEQLVGVGYPGSATTSSPGGRISSCEWDRNVEGRALSCLETSVAGAEKIWSQGSTREGM